MHCETLIGVCVGADHDDRDISLVRIALDDFQNPIAVQIRHHQIEQDETEFLPLNQCDRLVSTGRASDPLVTLGFEHQLQRVSVVLIVIDDKDAGQIRRHEHLELFSLSSCSSHWCDEPAASRRNVCPQKHEQDSRD
jgi:hypothetical protein